MNPGATFKRAFLWASTACLICACSSTSSTVAVFSINEQDKARQLQEETAKGLLGDQGVAIRLVISMTGHLQYHVAAEDGEGARRLVQQGIKDGQLDGKVIKVIPGNATGHD